MLDIFTSNIADTIKESAPQKTIFFRYDKPKVNYEDDKFITQLFKSKKRKRKKWSIINDTRNSKNLPTSFYFSETLSAIFYQYFTDGEPAKLQILSSWMVL